MSNYYPIATSLENELQDFDNPTAKMLMGLVQKYEHGTADVEDVFDKDLIKRLKQVCPPAELRKFCLVLYAAVARDITMCAQD